MVMISMIVDNCHVSMSDREVIGEVYKRLNDEGRSAKHRETRKEMYREALTRHHENQEMYLYVMRGAR